MARMPIQIKRVLSYIPTPLPVGRTEFTNWANSILELSGDYADRDSMTFAIASMLIHLPAGVANVPKNHFVKGLRKSAANQVASVVFQEIKAKQAEAIATAQKLAEDTAKLENTPSEQSRIPEA